MNAEKENSTGKANDIDQMLFLRKAREKAQGLSALICLMLRNDRVTSNMSLDEMRSYMYKTGVVLHNMPYLILGSRLPLETLSSINELDPTGDDDNWGEWCKEIRFNFDQELPDKPLEKKSYY